MAVITSSQVEKTSIKQRCYKVKSAVKQTFGVVFCCGTNSDKAINNSEKDLHKTTSSKESLVSKRSSSFTAGSNAYSDFIMGSESYSDFMTAPTKTFSKEEKSDSSVKSFVTPVKAPATSTAFPQRAYPSMWETIPPRKGGKPLRAQHISIFTEDFE